MSEKKEMMARLMLCGWAGVGFENWLCPSSLPEGKKKKVG